MLSGLKNKLISWKLDYVSLFLLTAFYYGRLQWSHIIEDSDCLYHAKMALFLREGLLLKEMPWMQFSNLRDQFVDHQLLYHFLLAPFTYITNNPLIGVKVSTVFFAASMITVFYWLLKKWGLVWPWLFAAFFMSFEAMTFRLNLVKVNSLSLIILWFLIYALFAKKKSLLFILGFLYVWLYGGWPLAILITGIFMLSEFIYNHLHKNKLRFIWRRLHQLWQHQKNSLLNLKMLLI